MTEIETKFWIDPAKPKALQIRLKGYSEDLSIEYENVDAPLDLSAVVGVSARELAPPDHLGRVALEVATELRFEGQTICYNVTMTRGDRTDDDEFFPSIPVPPKFDSVDAADAWMAEHS